MRLCTVDRGVAGGGGVCGQSPLPPRVDSLAEPSLSPARARGPSFRRGLSGNTHLVLVAASTVAIVAIAAAVIVVALLVFYILPRRGRRKRPPRT